MTVKKNGFALRAFISGDSVIDKGQVLPDMATSQFNDWSAPGVDLIREATPEEVAKARDKAEADAKAADAAAAPASRSKSKPDT